MTHTYLMILCGGKGERLWPLARPDRPKQFIPWRNGETLFDATLKRLASFREQGASLGVVTNQCYEHFLKASRTPLDTIISEPASRNTGPAFLYTALTLMQKDPNAVIAFIPADHYIADDRAFQQQLARAIVHAQHHDELIILGVTPHYPATGYGYIEAAELPSYTELSPVLKFYEKPTFERAQRFIQIPNMLWNIGIYVGKASAFIAEAETYAPALIDEMRNVMAYLAGYESIPAISFDYAVAEHTRNLAVLPCDFVWDDVGTLTKFVELMEDAAAQPSSVIQVEAHNNTVLSKKKQVALVGIDNVTIVETDDTLLVMKKEAAELVRTAAHEVTQKMNL